MSRVHILEISLAISFFMLGYITSGMIHRSFRMKIEGYIFSAVGIILVVLNWG